MADADPRLAWGFRRRVALARAAAGFETVWAALWPTLAVVGGFLVVSLLGLWASLPSWLHGLGLAAFAVALGWTLWQLVGTLRWPDREAALRRLERENALPHRPLRSFDDRLAGGATDPISRGLWQRHQARLRAMMDGLRVGTPRSALPRLDPWALRALLLLALIVALVEAGRMAPQRLAQAFELRRSVAAAQVPIELTLWITPPTYTARPPVRLEASPALLDDATAVGSPAAVTLPAGSEAIAQLHHLEDDADRYAIRLDALERDFEPVGEDSAEATLVIDRSGRLAIDHPSGALGAWQIEAIPDQAPEIAFAEAPGATHRNVLWARLRAADDYGLGSIALLLGRHGEGGDEQRIEIMRPAAGTTELDDTAYVDLTPHPWAGLPVTLRLEAVDELGQRGVSDVEEIILPAREFRHPVARAIIGLRRALVADPQARAEVIAGLDRLSRMPETYQNDPAVFLALESALQRILADRDGAPDDDVLGLLWDTALHLEDGSLSLAERQLRELQKALRDALARDASDEELERLMAELERALDEYLDALLREARENMAEQQPMPLDPSAMQVQRQDLQQMLDQMREMIRTGAREAAQQMLAQLQQLLENLQVAQQGQMQQGQQMMSQLQEMIQRQQQLLDQTFALSRQQGRQTFEQQPGQGGQQGQRGQEGQMGGQMSGEQAGRMAGDQDALRRALGELMRALGEAGVPIPRALGEAELSMRAARDALREAAPGQALDPEAEAVDQLRQGGQAMMQEMQQMYGQGQGQMPGQQFGQAPDDRDPLGRSMYNQGGADLWGERVPSELDLGQARAILEELYRRSSQRQRPADELDYLERLLHRF